MFDHNAEVIALHRFAASWIDFSVRSARIAASRTAARAAPSDLRAKIRGSTLSE
jgi:hypothetical protein